jgi:transposase
MMPDDDVLTERVARRIEIFTGTGRRRKWSAEAKARIVAESYVSSVGEVADRYGLAKTQLFTWRRQTRATVLAPADSGPLQFAPVLVESMPVPSRVRPKRLRSRGRRGGDGGIRLEIGGVRVRVERGADAKTVAAVIRALKDGA